MAVNGFHPLEPRCSERPRRRAGRQGKPKPVPPLKPLPQPPAQRASCGQGRVGPSSDLPVQLFPSQSVLLSWWCSSEALGLGWKVGFFIHSYI